MNRRLALRRLLLPACVMLALFVVAPASASAGFTFTGSEPSSVTPPSGSQPDTSAVTFQVTASASDPACNTAYGVEVGTTDDASWVRDQTGSDGQPPSYGNAGPNNFPIGGPGSATITVNNLRPGTIYHYRFTDLGVSHCPDGNGGATNEPRYETADKCFLTASPDVGSPSGDVTCPDPGKQNFPFIDLRPAAGGAQDAATLNALGDAHGCSGYGSPPPAWFEYGAVEDNTYNPAGTDSNTGGPGWFGRQIDTNPALGNGWQSTHVSAVLTGLHPGWLYHERAVVEYIYCYDTDGHGVGQAGTTFTSTDRCFKAGTGAVPCSPPTDAETLRPESAGTASSMKLKGLIHQHGCPVFWFFAYGPHGKPRDQITPGGSLAAKSGDTNVSETIHGLTAGQAYDVEVRVRDAVECDTGPNFRSGGVKGIEETDTTVTGQMPRVVGLSLDKARVQIAKAQIKYSSIHVKYTRTAPKGTGFGDVVSQSVKEGTKLENGVSELPSITLTIYEGAAGAACKASELGELKGLSLGASDQLLRADGCKVAYDFSGKSASPSVTGAKNTGGKSVTVAGTCSSDSSTNQIVLFVEPTSPTDAFAPMSFNSKDGNLIKNSYNHKGVQDGFRLRAFDRAGTALNGASIHFDGSDVGAADQVNVTKGGGVTSFGFTPKKGGKVDLCAWGTSANGVTLYGGVTLVVEDLDKKGGSVPLVNGLTAFKIKQGWGLRKPAGAAARATSALRAAGFFDWIGGALASAWQHIAGTPAWITSMLAGAQSGNQASVYDAAKNHVDVGRLTAGGIVGVGSGGIVGVGSGGVVSVGAGNVVAVGSGGIVGVGSGGVVAVGAGNVVAVGSGNFIGQTTMDLTKANVVGVGSGNVVGVGSGNVVGVGSGNVVSVGAGNFSNTGLHS